MSDYLLMLVGNQLSFYSKVSDRQTYYSCPSGEFFIGSQFQFLRSARIHVGTSVFREWIRNQ